MKALYLMGDSRKWQFMSKDSDIDLTMKESWNKLMEFLRYELEMREC